MYSVNPYSAIMAKADHVIAVSECVRDYVARNFQVPPEKITVIQRGVDVDSFQARSLEDSWVNSFFGEFPELVGKRLIMMPGRISRWKGQMLFLEAMARLAPERPDFHGIIVGGVEPGKDRFMNELISKRKQLRIEHKVSFLGQRNDISELYRLSSLVCHMSTKPEPFGRTVTEALASGTPVAAFDRGGAAETLRACFPEGLVTPDDTEAFAATVLSLLDNPTPAISIPWRFRLEAQTETTLGVYQQLLSRRHHQHE
jgi:glycosyltransferase involved in cell wall biosynthesis